MVEANSIKTPSPFVLTYVRQFGNERVGAIAGCMLAPQNIGIPFAATDVRRGW